MKEIKSLIFTNYLYSYSSLSFLIKYIANLFSSIKKSNLVRRLALVDFLLRIFSIFCDHNIMTNHNINPKPVQIVVLSLEDDLASCFKISSKYFYLIVETFLVKEKLFENHCGIEIPKNFSGLISLFNISYCSYFIESRFETTSSFFIFNLLFKFVHFRRVDRISISF